MKNKRFKCSVDIGGIFDREVAELTGEFMLCKTPGLKTSKEYFEKHDKFTEEGWWRFNKNKCIREYNGYIAPWFDGEWKDFYGNVDKLPEAPENCISMGRVSSKFGTPFLVKGTFQPEEYPIPIWVMVKAIKKPKKFNYRKLNQSPYKKK